MSNNNQTAENIDDLISLYVENKSVYEPWYTIFIVTYAILGSLALILNVLIAMSVVRSIRNNNDNSHLAKDYLIFVLITCDIAFLLTMSFTAIDGLTKYWPLGTGTDLICQVVKSAPSVPVYCSSMILMIIAVDRYQSIIHTGRYQLTPKKVKFLAGIVLITAILMAYPIFHHTKVHVPVLKSTSRNSSEDSQLVESDKKWNEISFCIEDWRFGGDTVQDPQKRLYYSIFSMMFQFFIPFCGISVIYFRLYLYLKKHRLGRGARQRYLARRTNKMLLFQSMGFCVCWFPLNFFGLLMDANYQLFGNDTHVIIFVFLICHIIGMFSTLLNPIMYGYWNEGFNKEIWEIFKSTKASTKLVRQRCLEATAQCLHCSNPSNSVDDESQPDVEDQSLKNSDNVEAQTKQVVLVDKACNVPSNPSCSMRILLVNAETSSSKTSLQVLTESPISYLSSDGCNCHCMFEGCYCNTLRPSLSENDLKHYSKRPIPKDKLVGNKIQLI